MKTQSYLPWKTFLITSLPLLLAFGCTTNDPVSPNDDEDPLNRSAEKASETSVEIYNNIASFKQLNTLIQGPNAIADLEIPEMKNPESAMKFAKSVQRQAVAGAKIDLAVLFKTTGVLSDSVIWDLTAKDEETGITHRSSLIYNFETGIGRLFFVGVEYPEDHALSYDSTEIVVDLNLTLFDDSDDLLVSLENLKRYKSGHLIEEERGSFEPDSYPPGTEPEGGILTSEIKYSNSSFISSTNARLEYHEGQGGSYSKESKFSDGKSSSESATFNVDGTGTFAETRRDGTKIDGTFDSAEEDGEGSYSLTTVFPAGHDPVSVSESGEFTINAADSTINGSFEREVRNEDGTIEKESVDVEQTVVGDVRTTKLSVDNSDGSKGVIRITESPEVDQVAGEWTETDNSYVVFAAQSYADDSAHLQLEKYASEDAFNRGDAPIVSGEFDFYPDGSGHGTVTEDGKTYDVTIHPDGSVTIKEVIS